MKVNCKIGVLLWLMFVCLNADNVVKIDNELFPRKVEISSASKNVCFVAQEANFLIQDSTAMRNLEFSNMQGSSVNLLWNFEDYSLFDMLISTLYFDYNNNNLDLLASEHLHEYRNYSHRAVLDSNVAKYYSVKLPALGRGIFCIEIPPSDPSSNSVTWNSITGSHQPFTANVDIKTVPGPLTNDEVLYRLAAITLVYLICPYLTTFTPSYYIIGIIIFELFALLFLLYMLRPKSIRALFVYSTGIFGTYIGLLSHYKALLEPMKVINGVSEGSIFYLALVGYFVLAGVSGFFVTHLILSKPNAPLRAIRDIIRWVIRGLCMIYINFGLFTSIRMSYTVSFIIVFGHRIFASILSLVLFILRSTCGSLVDSFIILFRPISLMLENKTSTNIATGTSVEEINVNSRGDVITSPKLCMNNLEYEAETKAATRKEMSHLLLRLRSMSPNNRKILLSKLSVHARERIQMFVESGVSITHNERNTWQAWKEVGFEIEKDIEEGYPHMIWKIMFVTILLFVCVFGGIALAIHENHAPVIEMLELYNLHLIIDNIQDKILHK